MGRFSDILNRAVFRADNHALERDITIVPPEPLEGTRMTLWNSVLPSFYSSLDTGTAYYGNADLADRVWAANVCQHKNSQQISAMPLEWHGSEGTLEPAWVSSPDPAQFPNGISDAMYAITDQLYGYGYSLQYVTDFYDSGYPRRWTVVSSASCIPYFDAEGRKVYKVGDTVLDPRRVIQVDRNPTTAAHGTSALRAFAQRAYSLLAAGDKSLSVSRDAFPPGYLKSENRLTSEQAEAAQMSWMTKTEARAGGVPVLGQGWTFESSGIDPSDMALLETQEWDARVICAAYGVPSVLLNIPMVGGLTYQNPLALMQAWWLTELRTTAKRVVDAFTAQMLPRGQWVSVDASDITQEVNAGATDDPQLADDQPPAVAKASPAQSALKAIGGGRA
ncbi:MAG TPA: phage portal protein [Vicinamibacterales bacterium]|nr:phage portal protein [Vicinamibacterales bacterium]